MPRLGTMRTLLKTRHTVGVIAGGGTSGALDRSMGALMVSVRLTGQTHLQCLVIVASQSHGANTVLLLRLGHVATCTHSTCALATLSNQGHHQRSNTVGFQIQT